MAGRSPATPSPAILPPDVVAELERRADAAPDLSPAKRTELRALMQPARVAAATERRAS